MEQERNGIPSTGSEASTSAAPSGPASRNEDHPVMKIDDDDGTLAELDRAVEAWVVSFPQAVQSVSCWQCLVLATAHSRAG